MEELHTDTKMTFDVRNRHNRQADLRPIPLLAFRSPFRADSSL